MAQPQAGPVPATIPCGGAAVPFPGRLAPSHARSHCPLVELHSQKPSAAATMTGEIKGEKKTTNKTRNSKPSRAAPSQAPPSHAELLSENHRIQGQRPQRGAAGRRSPGAGRRWPGSKEYQSQVLTPVESKAGSTEPWCSSQPSRRTGPGPSTNRPVPPPHSGLGRGLSQAAALWVKKQQEMCLLSGEREDFKLAVTEL